MPRPVRRPDWEGCPMPLFRVVKRPNTPPPETSRDAGASGAPPNEAVAADHDAPAAPRSGWVAIAVGGLVGLVAVAAVSVALVRGARNGEGPPAPAAQGGATAPQGGEAGVVDASTGQASINPDFNLEDVIARVNGKAIAMRDLDRAVRVARVLGDLSGDPVPANGSPELRQFQIQMLKRLIDLELMRQGAKRAGLLVPGGATADVIQGYLTQVGADQGRLEEEMQKHGVTADELDRWFKDARTANFFVTQSLRVGKETESPDTLSADWLEDQWATQAIGVNFYEP